MAGVELYSDTPLPIAIQMHIPNKSDTEEPEPLSRRESETTHQIALSRVGKTAMNQMITTVWSQPAATRTLAHTPQQGVSKRVQAKR